MSSVLLETFNFHFGGSRSIDEVAEYVSCLRVTPLPTRMMPIDWRCHVPMNLLENWDVLSDDERIALYVMGHCAANAYDMDCRVDEPIMN